MFMILLYDKILRCSNSKGRKMRHAKENGHLPVPSSSQ